MMAWFMGYTISCLGDNTRQVLTLKARLDGLLQGACDGPDGDRISATEALTKVTREHAALRDCLGDVERVRKTAMAHPPRRAK